MTAKNNALPTDVGEAKTDIVLENNDSQVPEDVSLDIGVCETEMVKETPSPGYEEFGEPPKTEMEQQTEDEKASKNQEQEESIAETDSVRDEQMATQVTEGEENNGQDETDIETPEERVHHGRELSENNQILETDREIEEGESSGVTDSIGVMKTDSEISEKALNTGENSGEESETVKPKRKRTVSKTGKAKEDVVSETKSNKISKKGSTVVMDSETETEKSTNERTDVIRIDDDGKRQVRIKLTRDVITIDSERSVETDKDKAKNNLLDVLESFRSGRFLTGIIQGMERSENGEPFAVIYHGVYKIIIPAMELIDEPNDYRGLNPNDVHKYLITKRLGTEIDYIVKGVDKEAGVAVASRKDAMKSKRKVYYFGKDREGNYLLNPGVCAEARVVSVIRAGIFVEVFGAETYIPLKELSYQRLMDAKLDYQTGQRVIVKILEIDRLNKQNVKVKVSVKQARENPYEKAIRKYTEGNCYVGTVSLVNTSGVFVDLGEGIDCLCYYPKRGRPPRGARVTVRVSEVNKKTNRIWGAIIHIAMPR